MEKPQQDDHQDNKEVFIRKAKSKVTQIGGEPKIHSGTRIGSTMKQIGDSKGIIELQNKLTRQQTHHASKIAKIEEMKKKMGGKSFQNQSDQNSISQKGLLKICMKAFSRWVNTNLQKVKICFSKKKKISNNKSSKLNINGIDGGSSSPSNQGHNHKFQKARKQGVLTQSGHDLKSGSDLDETMGGNSFKEGVNNNNPLPKKNSFRQRGKGASNLMASQQYQIYRELEQLRNSIKQMSPEKIMEKGYRHLMDALLYRTVRHDLDGGTRLHKLTLLTWRIQNSSIWNDFLLFLGWVYIFMSFLEPSNRNDQSLDIDLFFIMAAIEVFILVLQNIDLVMELIQRSTLQNSSIFSELVRRKKNFFRLLFFLLNTSDLIYYAQSYPVNTFRFARVIRPLQIIIFSKSLRRNFQGIINSAKNLLMILFFDIIICVFWAYIGINMVGDVYSADDVDTYAVDFRDFFKAANAMYIFSSLDFYPDILFPAVQNSMLYLLYFLPYLVLFLLLFAPIPVAVVYEGFRKHRLNILVVDRIKRRKALFACFQCIVADNKISFIKKPDFVQFFTYVYSRIEMPETAEMIAEVLWTEMDTNENNKVSIEEFFNIIDFTEQRHEFRLQRIKPFKWWITFREKMQEKFDIQGVIASAKFDAISMVVTLGSCSITIWGLFSDDQSSVADILDNVDTVFYSFFCLEIILKMIAIGPSAFFNESWNIFDLSLVAFQTLFDYLFQTLMKGSSLKSFSASRVLKIAKLQKIFRMFRAIRTVKILRFVLSGLDIIHKVYEMLYKIVICVPIVMKLSVIIIIVFYIYAAIGVEIFASNLYEAEQSSPYGQQMCNPDLQQEFYNGCEYTTFDSFGGAALILIQVCVGSGWGYLQFDYSKKYDIPTLSAIYFNSFHFLAVFVLALIGGLVWEVFDVVERIMRDQQIYQEQVDLQRQWEEQQQLLEGSFQSADTSKKSVFSKKSSMRSVAAQKIQVISQKFHLNRPTQAFDDDDLQDEDDLDIPYKRSNNFNSLKLNMLKIDSSSTENQQKLKSGAISEEHPNNSKHIHIQADSKYPHDNNQKEDHAVYEAEEQSNNDEETDSSSDSNDEEEEQFEVNSEPGTRKGLLNGVTSFQGTLPNKDKEEIQDKISTNEQKNSIKLVSPIHKKNSLSNSNQNPLILEEQGEEQIKLGYHKEKKKRKKKSMKISDLMKVKCAIENPIVSQKDKSQLILFQDNFQMSTLDAFFVNKSLKELPLEENQNENIFSQNDIELVEQEPQTANLALGGGDKLSKFEIIQEEEEDDYEYNKTSPASSLKKSKFSKILSKEKQENNISKIEKKNINTSFDKIQSLQQNQQQFQENPLHQTEQLQQQSQSQFQQQQQKQQIYPEKESQQDGTFNISLGNTQKSAFSNNQTYNGLIIPPFSNQDITNRANEIEKEIDDQKDQLLSLEGYSSQPHLIKKDNSHAKELDNFLSQSPSFISNQEEDFQGKKILGGDKQKVSAFSLSLNEGDLSQMNGNEKNKNLKATHEKNQENISKQFLKNKKNISSRQYSLSPEFCRVPQNNGGKQKSSSELKLNKQKEINQDIILQLQDDGIVFTDTSPLTEDKEQRVFFKQEEKPIQVANQHSKRSKSNGFIKTDYAQFLPQHNYKKLESNSQFSSNASNTHELINSSFPISVIQNNYSGEDARLSERNNQQFSRNNFSSNQFDILNKNEKDPTSIEFFFKKVEQNNELGLIQTESEVIPMESFRKMEKVNNSCLKKWDDTFMQNEEGNKDAFIHLDGSFIDGLVSTQEKIQIDNLERSKALSTKKEAKLKKKQLKVKRQEKKRIEMENFYQSYLQEVEERVPNVSSFPGTNSTKSQNNSNGQQGGIQKQKFNDHKGAQRELIKDAPKSGSLKNQLVNINQDLRNLQQFKLKIDLGNMNFIINKAILKSVDLEKIHNIEMRHFRQAYGSSFEDMLDSEIFPLWNQQAKLLFHFDNILKYDYAPVEQFIQLYSGLEMQISSLLMNKFSSFKIIYQDQDDSWFTINYAYESYFLQEVEKEGPWEFFESLFEKKDPKKLLKHRNIDFAQDASKYIQKKLKKYFEVSQDISNNFYFRKLQLNQKRSDIVYIPFTNDNCQATQSKAMEIFQNQGSSLPEYIMKDDLKLDWIPQIKRGLAVVHLFDNPLINNRMRNFNSQTINIEQAIIEEDVLTKEQRNACLNFTYSIEFLKDLRTHIHSQKDQIFLKISQFYFYRSCFEKNFCNIGEDPFEHHLTE